MMNIAHKIYDSYFWPISNEGLEQSSYKLGADLSEKIQFEHLKLQHLISMVKGAISENGSNTFKLFVDEIDVKLRSLAISFDEFSMQFFSLDHKENLKLMSAPQDSHNNDLVTLMDDMLYATSKLTQFMLLLEAEFNKTQPRMLLQDIARKSLVFYKQTNVVLKGYLRIYKG